MLLRPRIGQPTLKMVRTAKGKKRTGGNAEALFSLRGDNCTAAANEG